MAVTKQNIIDSLKYELKKLGYNNHPAIIEDVINDVYNQLISELSPQQLQKFEFYSKNYEVSVTLDTDSNRYYSDLPVSVINLNREQGGVIGINATDGTGHRYYPTSEQEVRYTENTEAGLYDRYFGYYVQRSKVWYTGMTASLAADGVRMTLAPQFKEFAATDQVPLPGGRNYELKQLVLDYIRQTEILDLQIEQND